LYAKGGFSTSQDKNHVPLITPIYKGNYCCKIILDKNEKEEMVRHGADANLLLKNVFFGPAAVTKLYDVHQYIIDHMEDSNTFNYKRKHCFIITQGVRIEANKFADILYHAFVYCTKYYKSNFKLYDYVVVDVAYDNGTKGKQAAQVICIVDVRDYTSLYPNSLKQLIVVQYMQDATFSRNDGSTETQKMYKPLKWD